MKNAPTTLRLILGDQLNLKHSWFKTVDENVLFVLMEVRQETDYVKHHLQKVLAFFASMRHFARQLQERGHPVYYLKLDDPANNHSIPENLRHLIEKFSIQHFEYQSPDEYRLDEQLHTFCQTLPISHAVKDSEHFLTSREALRDHFKNKKNYLMESFYRMMRRRYGLLMEGDQPVGGKWNYDVQNRQKYNPRIPVPPPLCFKNPVGPLKEMLQAMRVTTFGTIDSDDLIWPIHREQALELLNYFLKNGFRYFGTFQDAMTRDSWALFHSRLSFALNTKMLHPLEVIEAAIETWQENPTLIELPQIEGFVRQILGWREFMRGVYWAQMPDYATLNFFANDCRLPHFYWDGATKMHCLRMAIQQSLKYAYAHHIQRLMVTGNFALLAGVHPDEVDAWYLGIYIDAIEWVEITNTRGMSQFADGGLVATKPYVASANYLRKMSDYCQSCFYQSEPKYGDRACPFNSLYWAFFQRHRQRLEQNPRLGMMYRLWDRFSKAEQKKLLVQAQYYLDKIEEV